MTSEKMKGNTMVDRYFNDGSVLNTLTNEELRIYAESMSEAVEAETKIAKKETKNVK